jgi:hypothetical protein
MHETTGNSLHNLAGSAWASGERVEARALYRRALEVFRARLGPDHPRTVATAGSLARIQEWEAAARRGDS